MCWPAHWLGAWPHSLLCPGRTLPTPAVVIPYDLYLYLSFTGRLTRSFPTTVVDLYLASLYAADPGTGQGKAQATQGRVGQSSPSQTDETCVPPPRDSAVRARRTRGFAC